MRQLVKVVGLPTWLVCGYKGERYQAYHYSDTAMALMNFYCAAAITRQISIVRV